MGFTPGWVIPIEYFSDMKENLFAVSLSIIILINLLKKSTSRDCGLWQHLPCHLLTQHISQMISYASQQCWIPSVVDCIISFSENPSSAPCPCFSPSHTHLHLQGHPQSTCTEVLLCPRTLLWYDILLIISKRHSFKVKVVLKHFSDLVQNQAQGWQVFLEFQRFAEVGSWRKKSLETTGSPTVWSGWGCV